jgi:hypothetical protein
MKRMAFPMILAAILVAGLALGSISTAARTGISEEALVRSGHTIDPQCDAATAETVDGEPMQLAAARGCDAFSDGSCVNEGGPCGSLGKKKNVGTCLTVFNKHKNARCTCVR